MSHNGMVTIFATFEPQRGCPTDRAINLHFSAARAFLEIPFRTNDNKKRGDKKKL